MHRIDDRSPVSPASPDRHQLQHLLDALELARLDLSTWERLEREQLPMRVCNQDMTDPRILWNLGFHRRRVAALERALHEAHRHAAAALEAS